MYRLIETIKVFEKKLYNIEYHNRRFNTSRQLLFDIKEEIKLEEILTVPKKYTDEILKCRIVYSDIIHSIEFIPYKRKPIETIQIISDDEIEYKFKYEDRTKINKLLNNAGSDEIIIVKNNKITDASIYNLVFDDGKNLYTPAEPLLKGTKREKLINEGLLVESEIKPADIMHFKKIHFINALTDLNELSIPVELIKHKR